MDKDYDYSEAAVTDVIESRWASVAKNVILVRLDGRLSLDNCRLDRVSHRHGLARVDVRFTSDVHDLSVFIRRHSSSFLKKIIVLSIVSRCCHFAPLRLTHQRC